MMLKRVLQHLAVSWLENVQREQRVRKEYRARKGHHRQLLWQSYGRRHGAVLQLEHICIGGRATFDTAKYE